MPTAPMRNYEKVSESQRIRNYDQLSSSHLFTSDLGRDENAGVGKIADNSKVGPDLRV